MPLVCLLLTLASPFLLHVLFLVNLSILESVISSTMIRFIFMVRINSIKILVGMPSPVDSNYEKLHYRGYARMTPELACLWWLAYEELYNEPGHIHVSNAAREFYFNPNNYETDD